MFYLISLAIILGWAGIYLFRRARTFKLSLHNRFTIGTHVIVSGGSKGIGKALAIRFAELGCHVTIIARNKTDLELAQAEIAKRKKKSMQIVRSVSMDLASMTIPRDEQNQSDTQFSQKELLREILGEHERCDVLVNCCGSSIAGRFDDITQEQSRYMMDVNYFSAANLTRLVLPTMKLRNLNGPRTRGSRIIFVSSIAGLLSFYGYSAYSASKFALVGLAEALNMELRPFNIGVTIAFPPDTATPGFEEENKTKPHLTAKMSEASQVRTAEEVAEVVINDLVKDKFYSTVGIENLAILASLNTFMPNRSISKLLIDSVVAGPLKLVGYFVLRSWYKMIEEAAPEEIIKSKNALKGLRSAR